MDGRAAGDKKSTKGVAVGREFEGKEISTLEDCKQCYWSIEMNYAKLRYCSQLRRWMERVLAVHCTCWLSREDGRAWLREVLKETP